MSNLIDELDGKVRGITLNSQHIELFNILLNNDNRLQKLAEYLTDFVDSSDKEYVKKIAIKCINALEDDGKIDKDELREIFNDKDLKIKSPSDLAKILEKNGFIDILNKLWSAKDNIQTKPKEGIQDFLVMDEKGEDIDLERTYEKVKAFYDYVTGDIKPGTPRFNRITLDGQGKFQTYRSNMMDSNNNRIYNHKPMQIARDFVDRINANRSDDLMSIRVNTLCFYQDFPDDLIGKKEIRTIDGIRLETQEEYKERLMTELKNYGIDMARNFCEDVSTINIIDMFNEFINEDQTYYNGENSSGAFTERTNGWHSVLDVEDICKVALEIKKQMPNVDFGYNDWNFENPEKRKAIFSVIKKIEEFQKDLPADEKILTHIGMQFHTDIGIDVDEIGRIFADVEKFGVYLPFDITELDISRHINGLNYSKLENDSQLKQDVERYSIGRQNKIQQEILRLVKEGKIRGVTAWSQSDELSFLGKDAKASIIDFIEKDGKYEYLGKNMDLFLEYADIMPPSIIKNIVENTVSKYRGGNFEAYLALMEQQPREVLEYINDNREVLEEQIYLNKRKPIQDFNFHNHTRRCGHPAENIHVLDEEYVKEALMIGLDKIAFTDHVPLPYGEEHLQSERMNYSEFEEYLNSIESLRKKYSNLIEVQAGVEFEYTEEFKTHLFDLKDKIGSNGKMVLGQHWVMNNEDGQIAIDKSLINNPKREKYLVDYKNSVIDAMNLGLPDIIAHPDRYMKGCKEFGEIEKNIAIEICQNAIKNNVALEINLGELHAKGLNASYPSKEFWGIVAEQTELARKNGKQLSIVFGKDAHYTDDLSNEEIYEIAKEKIGVDTLKRLDFVKSDLKELDTGILQRLGIAKEGHGDDGTMPIAKGFLESAKKISESEKARNIASGQHELKANYREYDNPNMNLDNKSLED